MENISLLIGQVTHLSDNLRDVSLSTDSCLSRGALLQRNISRLHDNIGGKQRRTITNA